MTALVTWFIVRAGMGQLPLFLALQLLGSWVCLAVGPKREPALAIAMGFMIGLAITVFLSLPLLLLGAFTVPAVVAVIAVPLGASIWVARHRVTRRTVLWLLVWAAAFTALCVPFCASNVAVLTYDSHVFVSYGESLRDDGELRLETLSYLHAWGSFQIVAHALTLLTGDPFLYALAPAFSISFLATIAVATHRGLARLSPRARVLAAIIVVAVLLAIPLVRLHAVYVHANWAAAGYLFVFSSSWWFADSDDDALYLPVAFLAMLAFCFNRVESPMFAAPFLLLAVTQTRLSRRAVLTSYLPFTLVLIGWLALMASLVPDDENYLTPTRTLLMVAAIAGIFVVFVVRIQRLIPLIPPLVAIGSLLAVSAAAVLRLDVFGSMFPSWQHDLWSGSYWGYFAWPLIALLAILALRVPAPPHSRALRYSVGLFFALVVLLTCLGDEYGKGRYGSLTRITLQVVPIIAFYFALTFAPIVSERTGSSARSGSRAGTADPAPP